MRHEETRQDNATQYKIRLAKTRQGKARLDKTRQYTKKQGRIQDKTRYDNS